MSEGRTPQAQKKFGQKCEIRKDAPDYLKQKGNTAHPELIKIIQDNHRKTKAKVAYMTGNPIYKDSGC